MAKEENLKSKSLYKLLLIMLKYIPMLIALFYVINTATAYIGIDIPVLSNIAGMSLLTWIFMYLSAIVFRFCLYHRMFLYYILATDIINIIDYYVGIPITNFELLMLHSVITGVSLFIILYVYVKNHKKPVGEKFDMTKAKEVCERYRGIIPQTVTHADVYVAINAQYHDYCELFKSWFGDGVEQKIIESAVIFWFKDDDYKDGFKLWNYFKED